MSEDTKIYELVRGCAQINMECIPEKYDEFDMYKESSKCKNSNPKNLFNSPIFLQYKTQQQNIPTSEIYITFGVIKLN